MIVYGENDGCCVLGWVFAILFRRKKYMGLSVGRITAIAKSGTSLNVSVEFKNFLKEQAEDWIREMTKIMEAKNPDAKTILDENPQLSANRVKSIMLENTDKRVGASGITRAKDEAERLIKRLVAKGERCALLNGSKTLMTKYMDEIEGGYIHNDNLMKMVSLYTDLDISMEAVNELRMYLEEEMAELVMTIEDSGNDIEVLTDMLKGLSKVIDQARMKRIVTKADELTRERRKERIDIEEITDGWR